MVMNKSILLTSKPYGLQSAAVDSADGYKRVSSTD